MWAGSPQDASGYSFFGGEALGSALLAPVRSRPPSLCAMRSSRGRRSNLPKSLAPASSGGYSTSTSELSFCVAERGSRSRCRGLCRRLPPRSASVFPQPLNGRHGGRSLRWVPHLAPVGLDWWCRAAPGGKGAAEGIGNETPSRQPGTNGDHRIADRSTPTGGRREESRGGSTQGYRSRRAGHAHQRALLSRAPAEEAMSLPPAFGTARAGPLEDPPLDSSCRPAATR